MLLAFFELIIFQRKYARKEQTGIDKRLLRTVSNVNAYTISMKHLLLIAAFFVWPIIGIRFGCLRNATLSALSTATWLYNVTDCHFCACYTVKHDAMAYNCYAFGNTNFTCLIFQNYSNISNGLQVIPDRNQSFTCFTQLPASYVQGPGMHSSPAAKNLISSIQLLFHEFETGVAE